MARGRKAALAARTPKPRNTQNVYKFRRYNTPFSISKGTADGGEAHGFFLSDVAASTEFTSLFDEWRISAINVSWFLSGQQLPGTPCMMYVYPDYDDVTPPATLLIALQVQGMKVVTLTAANPVHRMRIKPRSAIVTAGATISNSGWHDVASPSDVWYGVKWWMSNYNSTAYPGTYITCMFEYELEFRSVR
jgi:hypothetical protein